MSERGGSGKIDHKNPFSSIQNISGLSLYLSHLRVSKPIIDRHCCACKTYLLTMLCILTSFNWSPLQGAFDPSSFQLHQTTLLLRRFPLLSTILCPWLTTSLLQLLNSFPFTFSLYSYLTYHHLILLLDYQPWPTDNCNPILLDQGLFLLSGQTMRTMRMLVTTIVPSLEVLDKHHLLYPMQAIFLCPLAPWPSIIWPPSYLSARPTTT